MFELPKLKYSYDFLEPYIDSETVEVHYSKHHRTYLNNLNDILGKLPELQFNTPEELLKNINKFPEDIRQSVINNAGGYYNHNLYWLNMGASANKEPTGQLSETIIKQFGSFSNFKELFSKAGLTRFGSGWAWLVLNKDRVPEILSTANQDSPVTLGKYPILALDVWEHAYYLKYQNRRAEYIENWWKVIDWDGVGELYQSYL